MEPKAGFDLSRMWADSVTDIRRKVTKSYEASNYDLLRAASSGSKPAALGYPGVHNALPQTGALAQRAIEEWERSICENKAVAILDKMQEGRAALIKQDGGEMSLPLY